MKKKLIYHLKGLLWGYPKPCNIMINRNGQPLTFVKIKCVYSINDNRPTALYKEWNVAVKTAMPEERFETHKAWMLNILCEHGYALSVIAAHNHNELCQALNAYKVGPLNSKTIKTTITK